MLDGIAELLAEYEKKYPMNDDYKEVSDGEEIYRSASMLSLTSSQ